DDLVTGVQTCALPISFKAVEEALDELEVLLSTPDCALAPAAASGAVTASGAVAKDGLRWLLDLACEPPVSAAPDAPEPEPVFQQIGRASCRERVATRG